MKNNIWAKNLHHASLQTHDHVFQCSLFSKRAPAGSVANKDKSKIFWPSRAPNKTFLVKLWRTQLHFYGTRCRRTRVLRHNCAHKTQNGKMLKRSAERVLRRHNCVIPIRHKIKIHFVLEDLSEDPRTPENSVDPTQNLCGPEDLIYQKKLLHCFLSSFKLLSQWEMHFFMAKSCQTEL